MAYPIPTAAAVAAPKSKRNVTAVLSLVAAALYLGGFYLPMIDVYGDGKSLSDSPNVLLWVWVVPPVLALILALVGLSGRAIAGSVAAGLVTGMVGMATMEVVIVHRLTEDGGGLSKAVGFWLYLAAVIVSIVAALSMEANKPADEPRAVPGLAGLAAVCFLGVPLSILLPKDGVSVFDIDDGMVKFAFIVWGLLASLFAMRMVSTRRVSGLAFGIGVGVAQLGITAAMMQQDMNSDEAFRVAYTPLYHWATLAAVVLAVVAMKQAAAPPTQPPVAYPPSAYAQPPAAQQPQPYAQQQPYAPQPVAQTQPYAQQAAAQPQVQGQWAPDPYGRHQYRLWDGQRWTANVADNGVVGNDPV